MKRYLLLLGILSLMPLIAQADVSLDINIPGVSLHLGDQDNRGYYWDGYDWRPPQWWHEHRDGHIGDRSERGYYWDGGRWQRPSEHDGHNPFRGPEPSERNSGSDSRGNQSQHNENNGPGQLGNNHSVVNWVIIIVWATQANRESQIAQGVRIIMVVMAVSRSSPRKVMVIADNK
ncbi:hypothetical protein CH54_260 [Yersinia rochesterensis]|uniref:DUF2502 domain-containing protein n=1 Tax=Yersinia rochesterensis TaxID=1604335 RepID=A0ABM5SRA2_9GAMM|nr:DUF2502 domain-containing protein [Yersinia rochesterensis]AIN20127.1 hypothetical protein DJ57_1114 [Yersinia rochesterensis]AJI88701.1 hypothetical protein AW19_1402 [Yersinia frederiksenii Y225]AJJ36983.1 hypothetical protein CH54_260 [Yersinia rochesterensis]CRY66649.1 Protein of uncharacterised function (DUF2502) [Yersinia kristensenii]